MVDIWVDQFYWGSRDLYAASTGEESFSIVCYTDTAHLLEVRTRTDKNPASSGRKVSFKQVSVTTNYSLQTIDYAYDALSRVTQARYFDGQLTSGTPTRQYNFAYDKSSNRTNETLLLGGIQQFSNNFSYNGANQISSGGLVYDFNGNLTNDGSQSYTWDRANRLLTHQGSSYAYNGSGQRVSQTVASVVTEYLQDTQPGLFRTLKAKTSTATERYLHDGTGIHSHESNSGVWDWALKDGLGSVRDVRNLAGTSVFSTEYAPYGAKFDLQGTNPTPFEYTGEPFDQNGLSYHRARYYDPTFGVWASQDPLETANRYGYVSGNPINKIDLTGLQGENPYEDCMYRCLANNLPEYECQVTCEVAKTYSDLLIEPPRPCPGVSFIFDNRIDPRVLVNAAQKAGVDPVLVGIFIEKEYRARSHGITDESKYPVWVLNLISKFGDRAEPSYGIPQINVTNALATVYAHPCFFGDIIQHLMRATRGVVDVERWDATRRLTPGIIRGDNEFAIEVATFFIADLRSLIKHDLESLGLVVGETSGCSSNGNVCTITNRELDEHTRISYRAGWYEPRRGGELPSYYDSYRTTYLTPQSRHEAFIATLNDPYENRPELDALWQLEAGIRSCIDDL